MSLPCKRMGGNSVIDTWEGLQECGIRHQNRVERCFLPLQLQHCSLGQCPWAWDLWRQREEAHAQLCVCCLPRSAHLSCWGFWDVNSHLSLISLLGMCPHHVAATCFASLLLPATSPRGSAPLPTRVAAPRAALCPKQHFPPPPVL